MSTYQRVISVITALVQQYITFNAFSLPSSQRRPEAIKDRINALSQNTVTALLSVDIGSLLESHFSVALSSCCGAQAHIHLHSHLSLTICRGEVTQPHCKTHNTHKTQTAHICSHFKCSFPPMNNLNVSQPEIIPYFTCIFLFSLLVCQNPPHQCQRHISADSTFI